MSIFWGPFYYVVIQQPVILDPFLLHLDPQIPLSLEEQKEGVKKDPKSFAIRVQAFLAGAKQYPYLSKYKTGLCPNVGKECPQWSNGCPHAHSLAAWAAFNVRIDSAFKTAVCRYEPCLKKECHKVHPGELQHIVKFDKDVWRIYDATKCSPIEQLERTATSAAESVLKDE